MLAVFGGKGSRISYHYYYKFSRQEDVQNLVDKLKPRLEADYLSDETIEEQKEDTGRSFSDLTRFLSLVGFIALLPGCTGVASAVHVYVKDKDVLWKRAAAFFLDNLLTMFPVMFVAFAIASVALVGPEEQVSDEKVSFILFFTLGVYFIVCALMESSKRRGTYGKRIMKLQITDSDGHPIGFGRALWRNIVRFFVEYSYLLVFPLIIQYFTFKKSKQLFHDQLSKTVIGERLKK